MEKKTLAIELYNDQQKKHADIVSRKLMPFRISLDWFAFTFKDPLASNEEQIYYFQEAFPFIRKYFESGLKVISASNHYEYMIKIVDGVSISWDHFNDKGVNVSVSGSHLGLFYDWFPELLNSVQPFRDLLRILAISNCRPSRADIAFDDYDKVFRPRNFCVNYEDQIISPYRSGMFFNSRTNKGETYQLGKRSSGSHLRIYDKDLESNGDIDAVRYEFELHGRTCRTFCDTYLTYGSIDFKSFFSNYLRLADPNVELYKYKSCAPTWEVWESFINLKFNEISSNVVLPKVKEDLTPERAFRTMVSHLKGCAMYCQSIPKDILSSLIEQIYLSFTDVDFKKMADINLVLGRLLNYIDPNVV